MVSSCSSSAFARPRASPRAALAVAAAAAAAWLALALEVPAARAGETAPAWRLERVLERARVANEPGAAVAPFGNRISLLEPIALAASATGLFVADRGAGAVLHYDLGLDSFALLPQSQRCVLALHCRMASTEPRGLVLARDPGGDIEWIDATGGVRAFAPQEGPLRVTALGVLRGSGDVVVLDVGQGRSFRYTRAGQLLRSGELRPTPPLDGLAAWTGRGWWIVSPASGALAHYDADGVARGSVPAAVLPDVTAIAADDAGHLLAYDPVRLRLWIVDEHSAVPFADESGAPHRFAHVLAVAATAERVYVALDAPARVEIWSRRERP